MKTLAWMLLLTGCFTTEKPREVAPNAAKVSVSIKRINFAYKMCKSNGKIKEIQIRPKEIIVCGNNAEFSK